MPIACVTVPHFALRVAVLERPELDGAPLVLGAPPGSRPLVLDASPEAAARGVRAGLGLREVVGLCPAAITLTPDPLREAAAAELIVAGLAELSPAIEPDPARPGCWYVDLRGTERLLGPPEAAARRLLAAVPPPLRPRAGVAAGKFAARAAAAEASAGGAQVVPSEETAAFLAGRPVALLPLEPETLRRLERLGLRTLGDVAALPAAALQVRFGPAGRLMRDLAAGIDPDPVRPLPPPDLVSEALELPAPTASRDALRVALTRLAMRAFDRPALRERRVRQARLRAALEGGGSWECTATLRELGGRRRVAEALGYRIADLTLAGPVERLTLDLLGLVEIGGRQEGLPGFRARRPRELVEAARALKQRYGASGLYRVVEVEPWSRIPERRAALIAYEL